MNHLERIAGALAERELDALLITSEPGEFYAAGFHGEGVILLTPEKTWYFTDSRYIEEAGRVVTGAEVVRWTSQAPYRKLVAERVAENHIRRLGFEDDRMPVSEHSRWTREVQAEFVPAGDLLTRLRMVKDAGELAAMREAQRITDEAFTEILNDIKPGVAECEIAAKLTYLMACRGAQRNSFDPIVASGANGSKPHAVPSRKTIRRGEFVTMDFGCVAEGYCSDMTRTVAVGDPSDEMRLVYDTVLQAQLAGIAAARAGVTGRTVHEAAAKVIADAGYGDYFGHGFGHSLGVEIHEDPRFSGAWDKPIPAGACLSAEPGIYLPGKFGVRIEDVLTLTEGGCTVLTRSPKALIIL